MAGRPLNPDEAQLWARVMASVRPMRAVAVRIPERAPPLPPPPKPIIGPNGKIVPAPPAPMGRVKPLVRTVVTPYAARAGGEPVVARPVAKPITANTLDGGWDKRLTRGVVSPDSSIDLHGHTLASAHALLDVGLGRAIARGDRVLLLVTGKPPRPESERPHARGAIRSAVADWLAGSRHADSIAAVRGAHPRHGGQGALYIVLRRGRD
ncbi:DNA mismatch repair protein MutS [Sphingomonas sp. PAMC26645]|uniref:Smr/MutS family protein n=1 Tax=Sphingomonas sp. PAMC26645 TaxID=2565555 RepID=UPI00109E1B5C|nr:Smr/MutS family protein [Sphingomonas sp. PAMC26645]QCB42107.1 DNA mismatch repair protein MutS [Sphingomonas sp. PAMC26645]